MFPCLVVIRLTRSIDLKLLLVHHNKTLFPACFSMAGDGQVGVWAEQVCQR